MKSFSIVFFGLATLLAASSCRKDKIDTEIMGKWRLVGYTNPPLYFDPPVPIVPNELVLKFPRLYEMRNNNTLISAGIYHIDETANPPRPTLHFSDVDNSFWISFSKDSLILTYAGPYTIVGTIRKYVRE
jgi:hypothetical protein